MPVADRRLKRTRKAPYGRLFRYGGFTLIELVTVLVIVGIVSAFAAPRLFDNAIFSQRGYADEIAASLRYARRIAVASACNVRFTVNAAGYSAAQPSAWCVPAGAFGVAVQSPDRALLANATPSGVAVGVAVVEFRPAGDLLNPVAPFNVGPFTVTVNAATGAVTVQ
jgi:MSHA pilin protein MshC